MRTVEKLLRVASELDKIGDFTSADEVNHVADALASEKIVKLALFESGGQVYNQQDWPGILMRQLMQAGGGYVKPGMEALLGAQTPHQQALQQYLKELTPSKLGDQYIGGKSPIEQSTSIQTFDPGDSSKGTKGQLMQGGKHPWEYESMYNLLNNPSLLATFGKEGLGQMLAQLGYAPGTGASGMQGLGNVPWWAAQAGNVGTYGTQPALSGQPS